MQRYEIAELHIRTPKGATLEDMRKLACLASLEHESYVTFNFNDTTYGVEYDALLASVREVQ